MISPLKRCANVIPKPLLPDAVGPSRTTNFRRRFRRSTRANPTPTPSSTPKGVKQPKAIPLVNAKPRPPPTTTARQIINQRICCIIHIPTLIILLLTHGKEPMVAPAAVISSITMKCNGGAVPPPTTFCQKPSLIPNAISAVVNPVQARLIVSRVLHELPQLTSIAPAVANGTRPTSTAINQALGGRSGACAFGVICHSRR